MCVLDVQVGEVEKTMYRTNRRNYTNTGDLPCFLPFFVPFLSRAQAFFGSDAENADTITDRMVCVGVLPVMRGQELSCPVPGCANTFRTLHSMRAHQRAHRRQETMGGGAFGIRPVNGGGVGGSKAGSSADDADTASGADDNDNDDDDGDDNDAETKEGGGVVGGGGEEGKKRLAGPAGFRRAFTDHVLPALRKFDPEMIFISAGFDGCMTDPLGGNMGLHEEDFKFITREIVKAANAKGGACKGAYCVLVFDG